MVRCQLGDLNHPRTQSIAAEVPLATGHSVERSSEWLIMARKQPRVFGVRAGSKGNELGIALALGV